MANAAKGGFPARPRRKIEKRKSKNVNHRLLGHKWQNNLLLLEQVKKNLKGFNELFGDSEEDEEFRGFSSEECGLIAYKRVNGNRRSSSEIPDILCSPIDLTKKKVTTRLAHARNSLDALPSSQRTRRRKRTVIRRRYSKSEVRIIEDSDVYTEPLVRLQAIDARTISDIHSFTKYKNSNLDFHRLSKGMSSSSRVPKLHKTSPIKPATFIAPSSASHNIHHVTNVTPTCLKIKINPDDTGPGHPKVIAKALLARANKRTKKAKVGVLEEPMHTSTPIGTHTTKSKARSFVLPTKSSRSSRIIKANRKYVDNDTNSSQGGSSLAESSLANSYHEKISSREPIYESPSKGRPLLKEATFRVAALANINNKPQPTRTLKDKGMSTRMRARKLIKRARFKHPTSSSTLIVGNDFDEEADKKKNLIREATFKAPTQSKKSSAAGKADSLSDLGLSKQKWEEILQSDSVEINTRWTKQEIHNVLHGANTFSNSWASIARHYDYHKDHRDWHSVKLKITTLQTMGLLSANLKVKSSILLQLKHKYSANPNVTVFTARELRMRGMKKNVECFIGEKGRMVKGAAETEPQGAAERNLKDMSPNSRNNIHIQRYRKWLRSVTDPPNPKSVYLGLEKKAFHSMCMPTRARKPPWSVREIHNVLHGIHIFGVGEWAMIRKMYHFQIAHTNIEIRARYKTVTCKSLVVGANVDKNILPLLQPKLSAEGRKYFKVNAKDDVQMTKMNAKSKVSPSKTEAKVNGRKRHISDTDLTSPPRKQAFHLFGTAPVWDDSSSASGLQTLNSASDTEEDRACENLAPEKTVRRRTSSANAKSEHTKDESDTTTTTKSGPRIKHVCRRASLVTGKNIAVYGDSPDLHLSALPKEEREKIAAEMEKLRDSESSVSSDTEDETTEGKVRTTIRKKEKLVSKAARKKIEQQNKSRCQNCKNCKTPKCGYCEYCRTPSLSLYCLRKPPCLSPVNNSTSSSVLPKEIVKRPTRQTRESTPIIAETKRKSKSPSPDVPSHAAAAGVILSPDSRRRLQQEHHYRDQQIPSIVKMDDWKERYELEDLWKIGGVSIITSTTPSTRFLCFLCGSVGKTRPMRRISSNSESSTDSVDTYVHTPLFIFCASCCEPFHPFCLDDHDQQPAIAEAKKGTWICKRCRFCNVCGRPTDLLECKRCAKTYHSACLGPNYPTKPSKNRVWVCMRCVRCRSCGASKPGRRPGSEWTHDFQLCQRCGDLFDKGNFCPICRRCYRDEDYETRMVQCGTCKRWVHSRCESLTVEMYTLLSHLPDDVQYVCPDCDGRRAKVELELNSSDSTLTDDSGNDSLDGDKMRSLLCKLPSPSWKKILESEVQTGIENVMMALFHNKEAACILKKSAVQEETGRPVDLFAVRFAVHNKRYTSVSEFSSDVCYILDTVSGNETSTVQQDNCGRKKRKFDTGARGAFSKEMHSVFPWFDVNTGRVRDSSDVPEDLLPHATLPPHGDHNYAHWQERDIDISAVGPDTPMKNYCNTPTKSDTIGTVVWSLSPKKDLDDMRQCLFCGRYGDDQPTNAGRLVYCGQDEWVHVNCALWSAEVFERHDGSLQNVYSAVSRGRMMKCELCKLPGATVGCNTRDCPKNYHFACAKIAHCSFQDDKKVFCARHERHVDGELVLEDGFEIRRRVVVDNDDMRPNKRWQRGMNSKSMTILVGSAIIHQLGHLTTTSDGKDCLIPVHFRMTRMFWSTVHASRRVRYTITVTEQKSSHDGPSIVKDNNVKNQQAEHHGHHTIAHASDDEDIIRPPSSLSKSRYMNADNCKSRLIDRMNTHGPLIRRKSHELTGQESPRSRRLSGSSYTVVGSCNRTLPQTITPLPTVTPSVNLHRRLASILSTSDTAPGEASKNTEKSEPASAMQDKNKDLESIVVSHKNPFLNLKIGTAEAESKKEDLPIQCSTSSIVSAENPTAVNLNLGKLDQNSTTKTETPTSTSLQISATDSNPSCTDMQKLSDNTAIGCEQFNGLVFPTVVMSAKTGGPQLKTGSSGSVLQNISENFDSTPKELATSSENASILTVLDQSACDKATAALYMPSDLRDCVVSVSSPVTKPKEKGLLDKLLDKNTSPSKRLVTPPELEKMFTMVQNSKGRNTENLKSSNFDDSTPKNFSGGKINECNSVGLLRQAKEALDVETVPKSQEVLQNCGSSANLWWKKSEAQKKSGKNVKKGRKPSKTDGNCSKPKLVKDSDEFTLSDDDDNVEPVVRRINTRSSVRRISSESKPVCDTRKSADKHIADVQKKNAPDSQRNIAVRRTSSESKSVHDKSVDKHISDVEKKDVQDSQSNEAVHRTSGHSKSICDKSTDKHISGVEKKGAQDSQSSVADQSEKIAADRSSDTLFEIPTAEDKNDTENTDDIGPTDMVKITQNDGKSTHQAILTCIPESFDSNDTSEESQSDIPKGDGKKDTENTDDNDQTDMVKIIPNDEKSTHQAILTCIPESFDGNDTSEESEYDIPKGDGKKDTETTDDRGQTDLVNIILNDEKSTQPPTRTCVPECFDGNDMSEESQSDISEKHVVVRMRKFAKETSIGSTTVKVTNTKRHKPQHSKPPFRRFSHDDTVREETPVSVNLCNGTSHDKESDVSTPKSREVPPRSRSKSHDPGSKTNKNIPKEEKDMAHTDLPNRRYPRRNPFTCLRSFSGLSPSYAIQSYSSAEEKIDTKVSKKVKKKRNSNETAVKSKMEPLPEKEVKKPIRKDTPSVMRTRSKSRDSTETGTGCVSNVHKMSSESTQRKTGVQTRKSVPKMFQSECIVDDTKNISSGDEISSKSITSNKSTTGLCSSDNSDEINDSTDEDPASSKRSTSSAGTPAIPAREVVQAESSDVSDIDRTKDTTSPIGDMLKSSTEVQTSDTLEQISNDPPQNDSVAMKCADVKTPASAQISSSNLQFGNDQESPAQEKNLDHSQCDDPNKVSSDATEANLNTLNKEDNSIETRIRKEADSPTTNFASKNLNLVDGQIDVPSNVLPVSFSGGKFSNRTPSSKMEVNIHSCTAEQSGKELNAINQRNSGTEAFRNTSAENIANQSDISLPPIEIERGIIEDGKSVQQPMILEPDVICHPENKDQHFRSNNNQPVSPLVLNTTSPLPVNPINFNSVPDMESPLSPRDEPRLPDETDATASFLVTSDCPVLNVDEVQSLLEMPATTALSTPTVTLSTPISTPVMNQPVYYHQPQIQSSPVLQNHLMSYEYLPAATPILTYNSTGLVVPHTPTPVQQFTYAVQIPNATVLQAVAYTPGVMHQKIKPAQQIIVSPPPQKHMTYGYIRPTYEMVLQRPCGPVAPPTIVQRPTYITTPNQPRSQTHFTHPVATTVKKTTPKSAATPKLTVTSSPIVSLSKVQPPRKVMSHISPSSTPTTSAVTPTRTINDLQLSTEQAKKLEKMIEFYSNKNKLSPDEKLIVHAIIAQQIKNKSLPLPSLDEIQTRPLTTSDENVRPRILGGQKRRRPAAVLTEPPNKKQKNSELIERDINKQVSHTEKSYSLFIDDEIRSPLYNVYMNAIHAETTADDKLVKKWRDAVRALSKLYVHIDVPWHVRKGQRGKENRLPPPPQSMKRSHLVYEIKSDDGYYAKGTDLQVLVSSLLDSVQECRANAYVQTNSLCLSSIISPHTFLGVSHDAIRFLVEQLPGAKHCLKYRAKYYKHKEAPEEVVTHINPHGCARAEKYQGRSKPDMFSFLASKHRVPPSYDPSRTQNVDMQQNSTRRPTSMDLPMAMRFRHLKTSAREAVGVYRSAIHGRGLYCKRDIEAGEMVMEYTGEVIRCFLTDRREDMYEKKGIGCYMFRMDDMYVVDATMTGSGARFINHSCEPSCYSRIVTVDGKKHIIIFALRKILRGEELTYDYKFPIEAEDQKIMCNCGAKTCRKYMN
uniref:[histone H3]-lysine(4) N-methyltransferase n=1 Tax=Polyandrocarpa misakiensis TaxID=7723 RepID=A0A3Q9Y3H5_POLMI|nr:histone-lysine N-methyltransferase 2A [Polyandrocarpa misakiensis]